MKTTTWMGGAGEEKYQTKEVRSFLRLTCRSVGLALAEGAQKKKKKKKKKKERRGVLVKLRESNRRQEV